MNPIFLVNQTGHEIISEGGKDHVIYRADMTKQTDGGTFTDKNGVTYQTDIRFLETTGLSVYSCMDLSIASIDHRKMIYTLLVVAASVVIVVICVLSLITNYITRPIQRLIARIKKIFGNDFSPLPTLNSFTSQERNQLYAWEQEVVEKLAGNLFSGFCAFNSDETQHSLVLFCWNIPSGMRDWLSRFYCKLCAASENITQTRLALTATQVFPEAKHLETALSQFIELGQSYTNLRRFSKNTLD